MFRETFESNKTVDEVYDAINSKILRGLWRNWSTDSFIGTAKKNRFRFYLHRAYMRNSFNKIAYGKVYEKDGKTLVEYYFISPFLSYRTYLGILLVIVAKYNVELMNFGVMKEVLKSWIIISLFPLTFGLFSQLIPASEKKAQINDMIKQCIKNRHLTTLYTLVI